MYVRCVHFLFISFVFFKQKTAYELRIRDWSSYVCSSDLICPMAARPALKRQMRDQVRPAERGRRRRKRATSWSAPLAKKGRESAATMPVSEIGRESCRVRVCQYV